MEWFVIILSSLLAAVTPAGIIIDTVVENNLRDRVKEVEQLDVRVDNAPSYQLLQGKIDRVRIASRGVRPIQDLRIAVAELETDPIDVDLQRLQTEGAKALPQALRQPFRGAFRVVVTEDDLDRALQSPRIKSQLEQLIGRVVARSGQGSPQSFKILNADLNFLDNNRFGLSLQLQRAGLLNRSSEPVEIKLEVGLNLIEGRSLQLIEPQGTVNGKKLSTRLLQGFAQGFNEQLDLRRFEKRGITARLLQFNVTQEELNLAAFVRVVPPPSDRLPSEQ
ncbi:DUF2993 domain-containing protein [Candidatus Gracilibacteria bacterium]|nr:DUF2993 domain-containing protein [Candidatus Gracilibacteria bacterium]NJQ97720.1 DUF2993 domain-containing protein [Hydrococcus sp. CSU_1_8]